MVMRIAWELGKREQEIFDMDLDEFARWTAFFKIQGEEFKSK